jgi:CheY-like chemotaxis protein
MSGDALTVLINDILDLAKVDAGKMVFEQTPFKMDASISAMIHLFETKINEKNIALTRQYDDKIPKVLIGDPVRLHQIVLNLVSNAVKFTSKGEITISVRLLNENEEKVTVEFSVTDTGIGIPEDRLDHIFENFQQASSETARLYGGTGLGLAISKQLVESQGGSISVKSKLEEGSVFSFILPFQKTNAELELENIMNTLNTKVQNIKVLVVEDITLNQLLMKTLLDDFGFEHDIADDGKIAIEKLQSKSYDIILMDLHMPGMNGFEATDYIRNKMNSQIPIIALTADVTTADLKKCTDIGMNDYISKPLDEKLLYKKIMELLLKTKISKDPPLTPASSKYTDLNYLKKRTKDNPELIMEMISLYLKQTPPLINHMKQGLHDKDWDSVYTAAHKLIPSFSIMGIDRDFETTARMIQEYSNSKKHLNEVPEMILQLETCCSKACEELEEELKIIKKSKG